MPTVNRYAPHPVLVPAEGPATAGGRMLDAVDLECFRSDMDASKRGFDLVKACADRAIRDGFILCLRPTADRPGCVDLGAHAFAVASLQRDFAARAMVVSPYDDAGADLREVPVAEEVQEQVAA
jgi:hypothetical protein